MTLCDYISLPLAEAYLCINCDAVGNSAIRCPACASETLLPLAGVLNREDAPALTREWKEAE